MEFVFWISVLIIAHSYIFYPLLLSILAKGKKDNDIVYSIDDNLPFVSILIAAYNEELVIEDKLNSIFSTTYPLKKLEILIGSDNSTDRTNSILEDYTNKYSGLINNTVFTSRQGKIKIINQLYLKSKGEILVLTDANVIFDKDTIFELVKHFKNETVGLVDSNMINYGLNLDGISIQEKAYISREVWIKNLESRVWGAMMGPFGGCYTIRKELYSFVPDNFLVDDFYINMKVFEKGKKAINSLEAKVFEDVSNNLYIEFKRKIRIATGDFQNLAKFSKLIWPPYKGLGFAFLSHKVIRWLGPIFIIIAFIFNILLINRFIYAGLLICFGITLILPIIDSVFRYFNLHIIILRFITHFYSMNLALLIGLYKYLKGVKTNVWQPTQRRQSN